MVKKSTTLAWMASLILAAVLPSCTAEKTEVVKGIPAGGEEVTYTFLLEEPENTKTGRTSDGKTVWTEGETIWYFTDDGDYNMKSGKVRLSGGKAYLDVKASYSDDYVIAVCGTSWIGDAWRKGFNMWNVAWMEQDGSFASAHTGYASAKLASGGKVPGLHFTNVTSIIRFETSDKRTAKVRFRANDGTPLCTEEPVEAWVNESLSISQTKFYDSKEDAVEVSVTEGTGVYYAGVIPCTLAKGFTVECLNAEGRVFRTMSSSSKLSLERSYVNNLGRLEDHYPPEVPINKITLSPSSINDAGTGMSYLLEYTYTPENATLTDITWKSSNTSVATVEQDGTITAQAPGKCTITASAQGGASATCSLTVLNDPKKVERLVLNASNITLINGSQFQLKAYVLPEELSGVAMTWTSSDESVATVSSRGVVTAKKTGTTVVTATNNFSYNCRVNVTSSQVSNKDLSASGTSNSYIAAYPGTYRFKATVKGNSTESVGTPVRAEVLWETLGNTLSVNDNTGYKVKTGDVITDVNYSGGYVSFRVPAPMRNGNALIAVRNSSGTILWSWHIWVCYGYEPSRSDKIMDRDLGALSNDYSKKSPELLGLLYQWGRKDPFVGLGSVQSYYPNEYNNYIYDFRAPISTRWPATVAADGTRGTIEYATANPMTYIRYATFGPNRRDWLVTESGELDTSRWSRTKTKYDPCPPGWRVSNRFGTSYITNAYDYTKNGVTDLTGWLGKNAKFALGGWGISSSGNTSKYHLAGEWQYARVWSCDAQIPNPSSPGVDTEGETYRGVYGLYIAIGLASSGGGNVFFGNNMFIDHAASVRCQRE